MLPLNPLLKRKNTVTMALDARHRSSIYQKFVPLLGDDDANALMSEFPASEGDELVTREFLRAELGDLRGELGDLRGEMYVENEKLHTTLERKINHQTIAIGGLLIAAVGALKILG